VDEKSKPITSSILWLIIGGIELGLGLGGIIIYTSTNKSILDALFILFSLSFGISIVYINRKKLWNE